jgi:large subunit ribosomal protein L15
MMIHEITAQAGKHKRRIRLGRGESSGHGKTCGRGTKGSGARAGGTIKLGSEGGNLPLFRRIAKRGFNNNVFRQDFEIVNVSDLEKFFDAGAKIDRAALVAKKLVRVNKLPVKILGDGTLTKSFAIVAGKVTKQAAEKITKAGGTIKLLELDRNKDKVNPKTGKFKKLAKAAKA